MSMSGRQAGIITDNAHTKARIESYWYNRNEKMQLVMEILLLLQVFKVLQKELQGFNIR